MLELVLGMIAVMMLIIIIQLKEVNKIRLIINVLIGLVIGYVIAGQFKGDVVLGSLISLGYILSVMIFEVGDRFGSSGNKENKTRKMKKIVDKTLNSDSMFSYAETIVDDFSKNKIGSSTVFLYDKDMEEEGRAYVLGNLSFDGRTVGALFQKGSSLNEGAVVVKGGTLTHANVKLPVITDTTGKFSDYGNRNKGGLGVVRDYNCVCVTTSSENGAIRIFYRDTKGNPKVDIFSSFDHSLEGVENITPNDLSLLLSNILSISDKNSKNISKSKKGSKKETKQVKNRKVKDSKATAPVNKKQKLSKEERDLIKKEERERKALERQRIREERNERKKR